MQTPESSLETLANRVAKLEAQNRRLRKTGIAALVVAAAVIAMGQAPAKKIIEANEFVLKDAAGKTRARLDMEVGRPTLALLSAGGLPIAALAGGDEPFFTLQKPGTTEQVQLGASKAFVGLAIYDKEIRAGLSLQKGVAALDIADEKGRVQLSLSGSSTETNMTTGPGLTIHDPDGKAFVSLGLSPLGAGADLTMHESGGNQSVLLSTFQGKPSLTLTDNEGFSADFGSADLVVPKTGRKESTSAASVVLFGKDKKVLWSAP